MSNKWSLHCLDICFVYRRTCWVCFATVEDDRSAEWVRPCRCRGTTKWVHQMCLQRWIDEKQRGNSMAKVMCPQCNAEYSITYPELGKFGEPYIYIMFPCTCKLLLQLMLLDLLLCTVKVVIFA